MRHFAELGIIAARGLPSVAALMTIVREGEDTRLPAAARFAADGGCRSWIDALADQMASSSNVPSLREAKRDEDMRRLTTIPGVGAITAATIKVLVPDPGGFKSARHFAAWVGLTPSSFQRRQGTTRRISKMGNPELRVLLVLGATAGSADCPER